MLEHTFLRGLVVIRANLQCASSSHGFGCLGELDGFFGRVRAGAGDDLNAACCKFYSEAHDLFVLLHVKRGRLPGGADGHDACHAASDLEIDEFLECRDVDFSFVKRCNNGGVSSPE